MKKLLGYLSVFVMIAVLAISSITADDFNWAGWYQVNGIYNVISSIAAGEMTVTEAIDTIIIPANNAGYVKESQINTLISYYPEAEAYLASQGIISADTTPSTETVAPAPAPEEPAQPTYTIEDCDMNKYATTDVNVRTEPDANAGRVGSVPQNEQAHITGETSNGWYRLEY
uniref:SH3 domain-containing protein n=1 Tax=Acetatifactor sp. TaxID=1872090 RepID=UPI0040573E56